MSSPQSSAAPISDERLNEPVWLIKKGSLFYRSNFSGYTDHKFNAGRYSRADAEREARVEPDNMRALHEDEVDTGHEADAEVERLLVALRLERQAKAAVEEERDSLRRRLTIAYRVKTECNDEANFQRNRATTAEARVKELLGIKEALEYANMGLDRIHKALMGTGPKQAVGEMVFHFMVRATEALSVLSTTPPPPSAPSGLEDLRSLGEETRWHAIQDAIDAWAKRTLSDCPESEGVFTSWSDRLAQEIASKFFRSLETPVADTGHAEADRVINRLMSSDPEFDDCQDAALLIRQLVVEHRGPDGFATWKDAAIAARRSSAPSPSQPALKLAREALEPFGRVRIPDYLPDDLWTTCSSFPFDESLLPSGLPEGASKRCLTLWLDGMPLSVFRAARTALDAIGKEGE